MLAESFRPNDGFKRVKDVLFIFWLVGVVVLFFALLTHDQADNNYLNDPSISAGNIKNVIGVVGAQLSDGLFSYFGICAFLIPFLLLYLGWVLLWNNVRWTEIEYGTIGVRIIGLNFLLISSCSLVSKADVTNVKNKGGHLGYVICDILSQYVGYTGTVLAMLAFLLAGIVLFTGLTLSSICAGVGTVVLAPFSYKDYIARFFSRLFNRTTKENDFISDESVEASDQQVEDFSIVDVPRQTDNITNNSIKDSPIDNDLPSELVDFTKPNIPSQQKNSENVSISEDNLVIPGLNTVDPEQPTVANESQTHSPIEERVEPTLNFSDVENTIVDDVATPYVESNLQANNLDTHNQNTFVENSEPKVEMKHVRTVVLPSPSKQRDEEFNNEHIDSMVPQTNEPDVSTVATNNNVTKSVENVENHNDKLNYDTNNLHLTANDDEQYIDTTNIIDFKDIRNQSENLQGDEIESLPTGFTPVAEGVNKEINRGKQEDAFAGLMPANSAENAIQRETKQPSTVAQQTSLQSINPEPIASIEPSDPPKMENNGFKFIDVDSDMPVGLNFNNNHVNLPDDDNGEYPSLNIFAKPTSNEITTSEVDILEVVRKLNACFEHCNVKAHVATKDDIDPLTGKTRSKYLYQSGPVITRYMIKLEKGYVKNIVAISKDIARLICAPSIHVIEVIPGQPYVGIEIPNIKRGFINMRSLLESAEFRESKADLPMAIGKDIVGKPVILDLAKAPHLLVAGTTGSGKSVGIGTMLVSLLMKHTPKELRLILIDPKMLEFSMYHDIPHLLTPIITDVKKTPSALRWAVQEMERRYTIMSKLGVRNISGYNNLIEQANSQNSAFKDPTWHPSDSMDMTAPKLEKFPFIVIAVDEFADLILQLKKNGDVEGLLARLAAKARACGIHIILATQSPRSDVITGVIRSNFSSQIAFKVKSGLESRIVIDESGAEDLLGYGDMLIKFNDGTNFTRRAHGAYIKDDELEMFTESWRSRGRPEYIESVTTTELNEDNAIPGEIVPNSDEKDKLYDDAVEFCRELKHRNKKYSVSLVQRQFSIGYNRASRISDLLERNGIISEPQGGSGIREVLIDE